MWLRVIALLVLLLLVIISRKALAPWARYAYFMRFSLLLWVFPLILVWANDPARARSLVSGIITPSRMGQYLCVAFFLASASFVSLIMARIAAINGRERFGDACPPLLHRLLADETGRGEWFTPVLWQLNNIFVFYYFFANGIHEGVDSMKIAIGLLSGVLLSLVFWYVISALYYLTYRPAPGAAMMPGLGRPAARTLLFPRSAMFLSNHAGQKRFGDVLERADLSVSLDGIRRFFPVPGYRWPPDGDIYEGHHFSVLAAIGFYGLYWVLWPITAPVPVVMGATIAIILYLLCGILLLAIIFSARPGAPNDVPRLRIWKGILALVALIFGLSIPLLYRYQDSERFPILALVLILTISSTWTLAGIAFFVDRYRVPVLTTVIVFILVPRLFHWDGGREEHYLSIALSQTETKVSTPADILDQKSKEHPDQPLIVVTSTGGGIHAAAWTTAVLGQLENEFAKDQSLKSFHEHVLLMSTVSGGSAGLYAYLRELDPNANGGSPDWNRMQSVAACSGLEAVGWGLVYYDIPKAVVPFLPYLVSPSSGIGDLSGSPLAKDRTWALRKGFERNLGDPFCQPGSTISTRLRDRVRAADASRSIGEELTLSHLQTTNGSFPAFTMNTTAVETGSRFLLANYQIPYHPAGMAPPQPAESFLQVYGGEQFSQDSKEFYADLPLATGAQLSATFPYVSSAATFPAVQGKQGSHFVDGGYYDNDGTASAIEFLNEALNARPDRSPRLRVLIVEIRNSGDPTQSSSCCDAWERVNPSKAQPWNLLGQTGAPLEAFWGAGHESVTSRNRNALALLSRVYAGKVDIKRIVFADSGADQMVQTDPLNWSLTPAQQKEVGDSSKGAKSNSRTKPTSLYECARRWFSVPQNAWKDQSSTDVTQLTATCPVQ